MHPSSEGHLWGCCSKLFLPCSPQSLVHLQLNIHTKAPKSSLNASSNWSRNQIDRIHWPKQGQDLQEFCEITVHILPGIWLVLQIKYTSQGLHGFETHVYVLSMSPESVEIDIISISQGCLSGGHNKDKNIWCFTSLQLTGCLPYFIIRDQAIENRYASTFNSDIKPMSSWVMSKRQYVHYYT